MPSLRKPRAVRLMCLMAVFAASVRAFVAPVTMSTSIGSPPGADRLGLNADDHPLDVFVPDEVVEPRAVLR